MNQLFALLRSASVVIAAVAVGMVLRTAQPPPAEAVRHTFLAYKQAVLNGDGATAAGLLSADTLKWYGTIQDLALHGDRSELEPLGMLDKIQVLAFRQRVPAEELRTMSARQLVAYSVARGWIGKAALARSDLGDVTVSGDTASASLLVDGKATGKSYHFVNEGGRWRFDQLPFLTAADDGMKQQAKQRQMTEDEFARTLVEAAAGTNVGPEIWNPPFPRSTSPGP